MTIRDEAERWLRITSEPGPIDPLAAMHDDAEAIGEAERIIRALLDEPVPAEHSDTHCAENAKGRGFCGDIECYCSCHTLSEQVTTDEREALALADVLDAHWFHPVSWQCSCGWVHPQYGARSLDPRYVREHIAEAVHAAGFRRSAPTPTDEREALYEIGGRWAREILPLNDNPEFGGDVGDILVDRILAAGFRLQTPPIEHSARYDGVHRCAVCHEPVTTEFGTSDRSRWVHVEAARDASPQDHPGTAGGTEKENQ